MNFVKKLILFYIWFELFYIDGYLFLLFIYYMYMYIVLKVSNVYFYSEMFL